MYSVWDPISVPFVIKLNDPTLVLHLLIVILMWFGPLGVCWDQQWVFDAILLYVYHFCSLLGYLNCVQ